MPQASRAHVGQCRTVRVSGFGFLEQGLNGDYGLDLSQHSRRVYRRKSASLGGLITIVPSQIAVDDASGAWVLTSDGGHRLAHLLGSRPATGRGGRPALPCGSYEGGVTVTLVKASGSVVGSLAFPAPRLDCDFHAANGFGLERHAGFVSLRTAGAGPAASAFFPEKPSLGRAPRAPQEVRASSIIIRLAGLSSSPVLSCARLHA
jgi:hypothetical protein